MLEMTDSEIESKASAKFEEDVGTVEANLGPKLDSHGFPLRPQPTDDPRGRRP